MENKLKLCLVPMEIFWGDKKKNLDTIKKLFEKINPETDLVVLPETFSTGFPSEEMKKDINNLAEDNEGPTMSLIRELVVTYNMAICGSLVEKNGDKLFNRSFFIQPESDDVFSAKKHLFVPGGEDKIFEKGIKRLEVAFKGWKIAMVVCYDIRFPVWCRNRRNEYDLLIAIANWPVSRIETWNTLLKARALENSSYVCGVNCRGRNNLGGEYNGSSHLFNYKGQELASEINNDGLQYADISLQRLLNFRDKFPVWRDADDFILM